MQSSQDKTPRCGLVGSPGARHAGQAVSRRDVVHQVQPPRDAGDGGAGPRRAGARRRAGRRPASAAPSTAPRGSSSLTSRNGGGQPAEHLAAGGSRTGAPTRRRRRRRRTRRRRRPARSGSAGSGPVPWTSTYGPDHVPPAGAARDVEPFRRRVVVVAEAGRLQVRLEGAQPAAVRVDLPPLQPQRQPPPGLRRDDQAQPDRELAGRAQQVAGRRRRGPAAGRAPSRAAGAAAPRAGPRSTCRTAARPRRRPPHRPARPRRRATTPIRPRAAAGRRASPGRAQPQLDRPERARSRCAPR